MEDNEEWGFEWWFVMSDSVWIQKGYSWDSTSPPFLFHPVSVCYKNPFKPNKASYLLPGLPEFIDKMKETWDMNESEKNPPVSIEVKVLRLFQAFCLFVWEVRGTLHQVLSPRRHTLKFPAWVEDLIFSWGVQSKRRRQNSPSGSWQEPLPLSLSLSLWGLSELLKLIWALLTTLSSDVQRCSWTKKHSKWHSMLFVEVFFNLLPLLAGSYCLCLPKICFMAWQRYGFVRFTHKCNVIRLRERKEHSLG